MELVNTYYTVQGDVVDALAHRFLGSEASVVALLQRNPHLLVYDGVLPANVPVHFVAASADTSVSVVSKRLW